MLRVLRSIAQAIIKKCSHPNHKNADFLQNLYVANNKYSKASSPALPWLLDDLSHAPPHSAPVAVPVVLASPTAQKAPEAAPRPDYLALFPEGLRSMSYFTPTLEAAWRSVCSRLWSAPSLCLRQNQVLEKLKTHHISLYQLQKYGLSPLCRPGINTTLYRTAEVAAWELSLLDADIPKYALMPHFESVILASLFEKFGPQIHRKDLPSILGGYDLVDRIIESGLIGPSTNARRLVLFRLSDVHKVIKHLGTEKLKKLAPSKTRGGR